MALPTPKALCEAGGISPAYAYMILSDDADPAKRRVPPRPLAIVIFRKTGWRHESIADLSEDAMATFEQHDQWVPPAQRQDAA